MKVINSTKVLRDDDNGSEKDIDDIDINILYLVLIKLFWALNGRYDEIVLKLRRDCIDPIIPSTDLFYRVNHPEHPLYILCNSAGKENQHSYE